MSDLPQPKKLSKKGGELYVLKGMETTGRLRGDHDRLLEVKHYKGSWEVHLAIRPDNQPRARASIALSADTLEELGEVCFELAEVARKFERPT
jgi:hypothetical protein